MDSFEFRDGALHCEGVPAELIARAAGTPTYVYSRATLLGHLERLTQAFAPLKPLICFSVKSCPNLAVLRTIVAAGAGLDVVSGGELQRALAAGCPGERIVFAGVGKTDAELELALRSAIGLLNVESESEFAALVAVARRCGKQPRVALRVNPDVDPQTHRYTSTGKKETKFGVDIERARAFFRDRARETGVRLCGLHLHIGSPVFRMEPFVDAVTKALALIDELEAVGHRIEWLDLGGGFGADYVSGQSPAAADYAAAIVPILGERVARGLRIVLEPGRSIAANAGILLTRIIHMKSGGERAFAICDAGMHTLLRPSHYDAFHFAWPVTPADGLVPPHRAAEMALPGLSSVDIVGPICESGDFLALNRSLPSLKRGDLLAIFTTGAYGMSMASRYNSFGLPAEVLVDGERALLIRRREEFGDLIRGETPTGEALELPSAQAAGSR